MEVDWKDAVTDLRRKILRGLSLSGFLLAGCLAIQFIEISEMNAWAGSSPSPTSATLEGNAERGREVFNGKGCATTATASMETRTTTATRTRHRSI